MTLATIRGGPLGMMKTKVQAPNRPLPAVAHLDVMAHLLTIVTIPDVRVASGERTIDIRIVIGISTPTNAIHRVRGAGEFILDLCHSFEEAHWAPSVQRRPVS